MKASPKNRLANSPIYPKVLHAYNELLKSDGKVNNKKFYEEVILPDLPGYKLQSWYEFLKRFKLETGIIEITSRIGSPNEISKSEESPLVTTMLSNNQATQSLISTLLNVGAARAKEIMEKPGLLSAKESAELALKVMKAQDSRIHAVGKIREDNREQEKFERAFSGAAYEI